MASEPDLLPLAPRMAAFDAVCYSYGIRAKAPAPRRYDMPAERLAEMVAEGWTLVEVAEVFGCHFSTVSLRITRLGLR
jgi:hypothetical protein